MATIAAILRHVSSQIEKIENCPNLQIPGRPSSEKLANSASIPFKVSFADKFSKIKFWFNSYSHPEIRS